MAGLKTGSELYASAELQPGAELPVPAGLRSQSTFVSLHGQSVEVALHQHPQASDTILLLHEALGSVAYWKDFPEKLAHATGASVLLYSRSGQGNSDGAPSPRNLESYLHEARETIPSLLAHFGVDQPIVYGHSEGAGLAMMYAAGSQRAKAIILESPFLTGLKKSDDHIRTLAESYAGSRLQQSLTRYHRNPDAVFASWIDGIRKLPQGRAVFGDSIHEISCPVLVLQGENDEFGTTPHLEALLAQLPQLQSEVFTATGHLPHRQSTEAVLARVRSFLCENN